MDELDEQEFVDVLPLVRRTFAAFSVPERRTVADRVDGLRRAARATASDDELDLALAGPALATVALHPRRRELCPSTAQGMPTGARPHE